MTKVSWQNLLTAAFVLLAFLAVIVFQVISGPTCNVEATPPPDPEVTAAQTPADPKADLTEAGPGSNPGPTPADLPKLPLLKIGDNDIRVETAITDQLRQRGLMYRTKLHPNHGMLFIFKEERERNFWMKNTIIPLDIAYADQNGKIITILSMRPNDVDSRYVSNGKAMYALEMEEGWFAKHNVKVGDVMNLDDVKRNMKGKRIE
jgi:uncharacterized membrane protein (UPF0127 family)